MLSLHKDDFRMFNESFGNFQIFGEVWKEAVTVFNNGNGPGQSQPADEKEEAWPEETAEGAIH